ncbi:SGNH/GDSL hydrolase family protein [Geminisphaera colitermitum]|uniref:SGNH/GDSL hydrolase family protein n=1 Tax=Geminisphaera colitermitum TaxID=1148786 RepID=UPI0009E08812|nr:SGNH/GDSL hydrolase family protein [Geminisphaera colitermitum]
MKPVTLLTLATLLATFSATPQATAAVPSGEDALKSQFDVPKTNIKTNIPNALRILFIGDSITLHGTNATIAQKLGWDHEAGMAASVPGNDYVHLFAGQLQALHPDRKVEVYFHTLGGSGSVQQRLAAIDQVKGVEPHLIVVQLGEHEKQADGLEKLQVNYAQLLTAFNDQQPAAPQVIAIGPWAPILTNKNSRYNGWSGEVENSMRTICETQKIPYISVRDLADDTTCFGWGTSGGVQWHPNDKGHAGYATKLLAAYKQLSLANR